MLDPEKLEELVDKYVSENRTEDAVKVLFDLIVTNAKQKNFAKAEALRDRLLEVDPSALMDIVKAADIIDEEKSKAVDQAHMTVWSGLYTGLNTDDSNTLQFAMHEASYEASALVFKQGDEDPNLYLVDEGQVKMFYHKGDKDLFIKEIGPGELAGQDTFFSNAFYSTHSLSTMTQAKLKVLPNDVVEKWEKDAPHVLSKLKDYCAQFGAIEDVLKKIGLDRRMSERFKVGGNGIAQFLDSSGAPAGKPVKVSLSDVSAGGVCFHMRLSKLEGPRTVIGRNLFIKFSLPIGQDKKDVMKKGQVVGVRNYGFGDNSVHIQFEKLFSEQVMKAVGRQKPAPAPTPDQEPEPAPEAPPDDQ